MNLEIRLFVVSRESGDEGSVFVRGVQVGERLCHAHAQASAAPAGDGGPCDTHRQTEERFSGSATLLSDPGTQWSTWPATRGWKTHLSWPAPPVNKLICTWGGLRRPLVHRAVILADSGQRGGTEGLPCLGHAWSGLDLPGTELDVLFGSSRWDVCKYLFSFVPLSFARPPLSPQTNRYIWSL